MYAGLVKPPFNPPNWVFAPVWTTLYALMAFAVWSILHLRHAPARRFALGLFFIQLALNAAWSWMFFAAHNVPQLLLVLATLIAFARLYWIAAWCLLPLAAWVGYAGALNVSIWWLNRCACDE